MLIFKNQYLFVNKKKLHEIKFSVFHIFFFYIKRELYSIKHLHLFTKPVLVL